MSNAAFHEIAERIDSASKIAVVSHVRPDGDAIGSSLALSSVLRALGKEAVACNESGLPGNLSFLPESDTVLTPDQLPEGIDLVIVLDTSKSMLATKMQRRILRHRTSPPNLSSTDNLKGRSSTLNRNSTSLRNLGC